LPDGEKHLERHDIHGAHLLTSGTGDTGPGSVIFEELLLKSQDHLPGQISDQERRIPVGGGTSGDAGAAIETVMKITCMINIFPKILA
jgi:hypothetical protein